MTLLQECSNIVGGGAGFPLRPRSGAEDPLGVWDPWWDDMVRGGSTDWSDPCYYMMGPEVDVYRRGCLELSSGAGEIERKTGAWNWSGRERAGANQSARLGVTQVSLFPPRPLRNTGTGGIARVLVEMAERHGSDGKREGGIVKADLRVPRWTYDLIREWGCGGSVNRAVESMIVCASWMSGEPVRMQSCGHARVGGEKGVELHLRFTLQEWSDIIDFGLEFGVSVGAGPGVRKNKRNWDVLTGGESVAVLRTAFMLWFGGEYGITGLLSREDEELRDLGELRAGIESAILYSGHGIRNMFDFMPGIWYNEYIRNNVLPQCGISVMQGQVWSSAARQKKAFERIKSQHLLNIERTRYEYMNAFRRSRGK